MLQPRQRDSLYLAALASSAALASFLYYFRSGEILLYGDAVAHIHIARRVFDSLTPSPLQLGTVWLPLPHLLMMPFLVVERMWRSGAGSSIPSLVAYVAGVVGVFRLVRGAENHARRTSAWLAAITYAANPNLIYLQTTAMTEPLYLAFFVWTVVFLDEFARNVGDHAARAARSLEGCGIVLGAAMLTRYDGWFLAACVVPAAVVIAWRKDAFRQPAVRRALRNLVLFAAAIAGLWLAYNYREYRNPLEFATGPYSARSIAQRSGSSAHHPGYHHLPTAAIYFLKCANLNLGEGASGAALMLAAVVGTLLLVLKARHHLSRLVLWLPVAFYTLSIAYGSVPIFIPVWWPFSYVNVRYGLQLLPAMAVFVGFAVAFLLHCPRFKIAGRGLAAATVATVVLSYATVWQATPICLREARTNSATRVPFEARLAQELAKLPPDALLLMYTGDYPGALQRAGIPFRRVITETNHPHWEQALLAPAQQAHYVVAMEGDPVSAAVAERPQGLDPIAAVESPGQPRTTVYKSRVRAGALKIAPATCAPCSGG